VFGIPDFRLAPDPYIAFEDEYEKARLLAEQADQLSFEALVRFYWEITPDVPRAAVHRYIHFALSGEDRGKACLEVVDAHVGGRGSGQACLEIGCGTGGFLCAARHRWPMVVGADIALRWLVIAKKRLASVGEDVSLVCCAAEHLPFPEGTFDCIVGLHMLEHTQDQQAVLSETTRALKRNGWCFFSTPNRYSLGPEPCVRIWGVGFVPRSWASGYVRLIAGIPYRHIRLLSSFELQRLLARAGLRAWTISPLRLTESEQQVVAGCMRLLLTLYHLLLERPFWALLLRICGPFLLIAGRK